MKISKRDVLMFFLGFATLFIIETIYDWDSTIGEILSGFEAGLK